MDLGEIEARRNERKAELARKKDTQKAIDLEQVDKLELEHGDSNIDILEVPFTEGLPVIVAVRCPTGPEINRYRHQIKPRKSGAVGDTQAAADLLGRACCVYPASEDFDKICELRPSVLTQAGVVALNLSVAKTEALGNG